MTSELDTPGKRLAEARKRAGYRTQKAFYNKFKIPQPTHSMRESGVRGIDPETAQEYARYLGNCSAEWILYGHGQAPGAIDAPASDTAAARPIMSFSAWRQQEQEAFDFLHDRILSITHENDEALLREFDLVLRSYGFEWDTNSIGKLAFYLLREIQEDGGASSLLQRAQEKIDWLQQALDALKDSLRKLDRLFGANKL
jgi:hypothetical protein